MGADARYIGWVDVPSGSPPWPSMDCMHARCLCEPRDYRVVGAWIRLGWLRAASLTLQAPLHKISITFSVLAIQLFLLSSLSQRAFLIRAATSCAITNHQLSPTSCAKSFKAPPHSSYFESSIETAIEHALNTLHFWTNTSFSNNTATNSTWPQWRL